MSWYEIDSTSPFLMAATAAELQPGTAGVHAHLPFESVERFTGDFNRVREELEAMAAGDEVFIVAPTEGEVERLREILAPTKLAASGRLHFPIGSLNAGFKLRAAALPREGAAGERSG